MDLNKKLFILGIIGSVLCFTGDMLLGCFMPSKEFGNSIIFQMIGQIQVRIDLSLVDYLG